MRVLRDKVRYVWLAICGRRSGGVLCGWAYVNAWCDHSGRWCRVDLNATCGLRSDG